MIRRRLLERAGLLLRTVGTRRHSSDSDRVLAAALRVMRASRFCVLVTDGADGSSARVVQPFRPGRDLAVHLGTDPGSRKAREIAASGRALLVYERDRDGAGVVARCTAHVLDDPAARRRWFMPAWRAFWPDGPTDRAFTVIRCEPFALEVWDARRGITPPPFGLRSAVLRRDGDGWRAETGP